MKNDESKMQQAAVEQLDHIFNIYFRDYLVLLADSKKVTRAVAPVFAVPNGGNRNVVTATIMKREGVRSGIADLILPIPNRKYSQLWLELKLPKGRQSVNQKQWESFCKQVGIKYVVCRSTQEVTDEVMSYMKGVL